MVVGARCGASRSGGTRNQESKESVSEAASDNWSEDVLNRKQYADFLTTFVEGRCVPEAMGLVLAIDAAWGLGKTFFTHRWALDLKAANRAVVVFDAWANDSGEDPAVSFMAELREAIAPLYKQLPVGDALHVEVVKRSQELVKNLRRATVPALAVVGKALLKKATGVALDEVIEAVGQSDSAEEGFGEQAEAAPEALEKGLDAFFEKALQAHNERIASVHAFRASLEQLVNTLRRADLMHGPLYVFIDELDRCRPDYAIRLLEGVKHLFNVKGVAFIVSTNLHQLSKAVGAVYGDKFDGYGYLKRFFDLEYQLPEPTRLEFIKACVKETSLAQLSGASGFDPVREDDGCTSAHVLSAVADAFSLDLRSIQRVIAIAEAAVSGAKKGTHFVALWLFFLASLRHHSPEEFTSVRNMKLDAKGFEDMCHRILTGRSSVVAVERNERGPTGRKIQTPMIPALRILYQVTLGAPGLFQEAANSDPWTTDYPRALLYELMTLWSNIGNKPQPLQQHAELVAAAGYMSK